MDRAMTRGGWQVLEWAELALCAQVDGDLLFPERGTSNTDAKAVCNRCPVRERCLTYAIDNGEHDGIWGGKTDRERRKIKDARAAA